MIENAYIFIILLLAILLSYMAWKLKGLSWKEYFSTKDGLGILKGIVLAPVAIIILAIILYFILPSAQADDGFDPIKPFKYGTWFNDASVFAGLDYTKKRSPQCDANIIDDRGTSNLGVRLNIWQSASKDIRLNSKYTHHSCALGSDDRQYDAIGVELEWTVWRR